ncbi:MAG: DUF4143 domain-containing protein, partial [Gammaproteobacteria bacterium]|nr:DUF4143 domain-containing protein [Gammaproteobacteria bacterium]
EKQGSPGAFLEIFLGGGLAPEIRPSSSHSPVDLPARLVAGGYPETLRRAPRRAGQWRRNYLRAIIERDVPDIARVRDATRLQTVLAKIARQSGSLLNRSAFGRDLGLDRDTVNHYLDILERLFLVRLLPAWHRNRGKRLVKSPKIHFLDTGLAATLMDLSPEDWNTRRQDYGCLLESFVVQQLIALSGWSDPALEFYHYRDRDQVEVDCVITKASAVWGVEVKTSRSVGSGDLKGLHRLAEQAGSDFQGGIVFYAGDSILPLGDPRFLAVPLSRLWEL